MQNKSFGDEIQRLLRYAQKRRFTLLEQKRIESEISLQTYLRSLIQLDKERRMQMLIDKYIDDNELSSMNSRSLLKQYLVKMNDVHLSSCSTSNVDSSLTSTQMSDESKTPIDSQLEHGLHEIAQASDQSLSEINNLFNEVDLRRKRREIPEYLTCKLCYDLMKDPVITPCKLPGVCFFVVQRLKYDMQS
jgi:STIP1 homology and U-box containing protein 1